MKPERKVLPDKSKGRNLESFTFVFVDNSPLTCAVDADPGISLGEKIGWKIGRERILER